MTQPVSADLVITHARLAAPGAEAQAPLQALAVSAGKISWVGAIDAAPSARQTLDARGQWLTPGLIDCHTHLIFGGNRAQEFAWRQQGVSYQTIAERGGGIRSTVTATRNASDAALLESAGRRLQTLIDEGVCTVEIKSGYGLTLEQELRMLRLARQLGRDYPVNIHTTLLAAHALPPEFSDKDAYIDHIVQQILPAAVDEGLADAVDVFCEGVGFSPAQCERVFSAACALGLPVKGHVEQLSDLKGARLVAQYQGLSVDHIEYLQAEDVAALKPSGTVAVLLPAAFYFLRETQLPPIAALREHAIPMAVATDCNPGTAPQASLLTAMNQACILFGLTPDEALAGVTTHAAKALGLHTTGELRVGHDADLLLWDIGSPAEISYGINLVKPVRRWLAGVEQ
ncbi:imidazolonepropionase [Simiduia agarivorans]|uniref:Imidazolonepropionase n=1 Tax=Simiduia agarivorans (strain DSM 21679 / JCM 13881 / BCRC 17597 / SA1) TaxID=1117647 RepID=K4KIE2_SIMAS|nr:imidazolonepropionase [Simiduia agarivorans]AFU97975.1 imidazolonepropionase [Simiduia agarivorans SA1 = DSM 21679]